MKIKQAAFALATSMAAISAIQAQTADAPVPATVDNQTC